MVLVDGTDGYDATDALIADPTNDNRVVRVHGRIRQHHQWRFGGSAGRPAPSNATDVATS